MEVSDARKLKGLEDENARLKRLGSVCKRGGRKQALCAGSPYIALKAVPPPNARRAALVKAAPVR